MTRYAAYIRTSTTKQTTGAQSQRSAILEWFADHDAADWDEYADAAQSGVDDSRKAFRELLEAVRNDRYNDVVMVEYECDSIADAVATASAVALERDESELARILAQRLAE